jgi:hypothetical protein
VNYLTGDDTYCLDRWVLLTEVGQMYVQRWNMSTGSTNAPGPFRIRLTQPQAAPGQYFGILQIVEGNNSFPLRGQSVTLQALVTNTNSTSLKYAILEWTGVADTVTSDVVRDWTSTTYTPNNFFISSNLTVAAVGTIASGTDVSAALTATISTACNNLIVFFWTESRVPIMGKVYITNVDCHTGGTRLWNPRPIQQEIALCQRYYEKSYPIDMSPGTSTMTGMSTGWVVPTGYGWMRTPMTTSYLVTKRVQGAIPVIYSPYSGSAGWVGEYNAGSAWVADRTVMAGYYSNNSFCIQKSGSGTAWTSGNYIWNHWTVDAEL